MLVVLLLTSSLAEDSMLSWLNNECVCMLSGSVPNHGCSEDRPWPSVVSYHDLRCITDWLFRYDFSPFIRQENIHSASPKIIRPVVKFSHTLYRTLGPDLIPVYRSTGDFISHSHPKNVTVLRPVPSYTVWWQRHIGVNNLPGIIADFWEIAGNVSTQFGTFL